MVSQDDQLKMCARRYRFSRKRILIFILFALAFGCICYTFARRNILKIPIYVVEEHHEVLPYWFDSAESGKIKKFGNTLIHIDGHSDDAPPEYFLGYPHFKWPKKNIHIDMMMQRNDVFIVAAIMTGLITRFIWIWPSWDHKEHHTDHLKIIGYLGSVRVRGASGMERVFCDCKKQLGQGEMECIYANYSHSAPEIELDPHKCDVHAQYTAEFMSAEVAMQMLKKQNLIYRNESIILDIDEDYFGCESGVGELLQKGIQWKRIEVLNKALGKFFCPYNAHHEQLADKLMFEMINTYLKICDWSSGKLCTKTADFMKRNTEKYALKVWSKFPSTFCARNNVALSRTWKNVSNTLHTFKYDHLVALRNTGFCLSLSPKTYIFDEVTDAFKVCHGVNSPGETIVNLHSPSKDEVLRNIDQLTEILKNIGDIQKPGIVTLCRSFRDGYIPKGYFHQIESGILNAVKEIGKEKSFQVQYDKELLGGSKGWLARHEAAISALL